MRPSLLALAITLLVACGPDSEPVTDYPTVPSNPIFTTHCGVCHGPDGAGVTGLGQDLRDKGEHWDAGRLHEYLKDPAAFAKKVDRLGAKPMPALASNVTEADTAELVQHVLALMGK